MTVNKNDLFLEPLKAYACYNTDKNTRLRSSSGGVFSALAEFVIEQRGVVYGVAISEDCYSAEFISVTSKKDLDKLRGSKYLQAKVGTAYMCIKKDLELGKFVLFSGTGCQVNGLKKFLSKEYEKLICVDVICHGTPSPALWREYVAFQEQKIGGKLKDINFRCKKKSWEDFGVKEVYKSIANGETKNLYVSKEKNAYMQMFLRDYCLRPSCYDCLAKRVKMSDLTIADFWGINAVVSDMNDGLGTSLVLVRTDKGKDIFDKICNSMKFKEVSYKESVKNNPAEFRSCTRPKQREIFYDDMYRMSFENLKKKYAVPVKIGLKNKVTRKIKNTIKKLLRVIGVKRKS